MTRHKTYHHGDLRAALLAAAREGLSKESVEKLSLAKLTASLGVSPAAVYRHFAGREALLAALTQQTLTALEARSEAAAATPGDAIDKLRAACASYLDFADEEPGLFRLLHASEIPAVGAQTSGFVGCYAVFESLVQQAAPSLGAANARFAAALIWSQLHGYVLLQGAGLFQRVKVTQSREAVVEAAVRTPSLVAAMGGVETLAAPPKTRPAPKNPAPPRPASARSGDGE